MRHLAACKAREQSEFEEEIGQVMDEGFDFRTMMDEQRRLERLRPTNDRIYIGGEIIVDHLVKSGCSTFSGGRVEDREDAVKVIYSRFAVDGSHT